MEAKHINDRHPNFYEDDRFYLVRCYACDRRRGKENWGCAVAMGYCCWCGWESPDPNAETSDDPRN